MSKLALRSRLPDSAANVPAVIMVHGWLGNEDVMWAFESFLPNEAAVFSPRGVIAAEGGYGWWRQDDYAATFAHGVEALRDFVMAVRESYPIDPTRLALMGFSQGAAACASLLLREPELARGVALLAGFLPGSARAWATPNRLAGKRIFIAHGTDDATVPIAEARSARDVLAATGAAITYGEYAAAHKMTPQGLRALRQWLIEMIQ